MFRGDSLDELKARGTGTREGRGSLSRGCCFRQSNLLTEVRYPAAAADAAR